MLAQLLPLLRGKAVVPRFLVQPRRAFKGFLLSAELLPEPQRRRPAARAGVAPRCLLLLPCRFEQGRGIGILPLLQEKEGICKRLLSGPRPHS